MALLLSLNVSVMCYRNAFDNFLLIKKKPYWLLISLSLIQVFMNSVDHRKIV